MTYDLFNLTLETARRAHLTTEGKLTGALADSVQLARYGNSFWNYGAMWLTRDSAGAGAAPEGEYRTVATFTQSGGVLTVDSGFSAATAAGDSYALGLPSAPINDIIGVINKVLQTVMITVEDITSLDTAALQTEYTLPAAILDTEHIEVWRQTNTGDTNRYHWTRMHDWYISEQGTGSQKLLIFYEQPHELRDLKLVYRIPHPPLYTETAQLREGIDLAQVATVAAYELLMDMKGEVGTLIRDADAVINELGGKAAGGIRHQTTRPKLATY